MPETLPPPTVVNIEDEMRKSYMAYAMSVIIGRAIPDVRDGLKPVHRRILYAMFREGLLSNRGYSKCAGVVGEVLKKYHPHGDSAVYDALVRLVQSFSVRYPLVDGQGNFGSIDGDPAAAYRYTEARLNRLAEEMLSDIDRNTVDFLPNFDESTLEPTVLPSKIPNLLLNGSTGIAVGMATNIPPHNLGELVDALIALVDNPDMTVADLMKHVPGPDFPTGAYLCGTEGIKQAYETGRGSITLRARISTEPVTGKDKTNVVITEIPYQLNKSRLIERIADLVNERRIEGVSDIRDESDRDGMRVVIELKRGEDPEVVTNQLFKLTPLQGTFGIIMLAIVNNQPVVLNLRQALRLFVEFRREVVTRRTAFDLKKAEERAHLLEGYKIALDNIDAVVNLIKRSAGPPEAKQGLIRQFRLSDLQAQAILDLRLQRLTGLERKKILDELAEIRNLIKDLKDILAKESRVREIIQTELLEMKEKYGDERRTEIVGAVADIDIEELIKEEDMVVTISHGGYIKRNAVSLYRAQRRGGKGKMAATTKEDDFVESLFVASTHSYILFFTNTGRIYWLKVHELPQMGRAARGKAIVNLLQIEPGETVAAHLPVREFTEGSYVIVSTAKGLVKKTSLMAYSNPRKGGIIGMVLEKGDELIAARLIDGQQHVFLASASGLSIRFKEQNVRPMGRVSRGVKGMALGKGDRVVSMETSSFPASLLTVCERGYGKRTATDEYRVQTRGGKGIITIKTTERNGRVKDVKLVTDVDDLMIITSRGKIVRTNVRGISEIGRNTQGVRLVSLEADEKVTSVARLAEKEEEAEEGPIPTV
ncbi:MAG: DNA gyrase subunit A [Deltaproteobacteria bacterium]|nr:DNA gyrase subunit A [Deltaproteobacteria bacterium]